jgi:hypothetical protein
MLDQYITSIDTQLVSEEDTSRGDVKAETGSEIIAAQHQALQIQYYAIKILHAETDGKCVIWNNLTRQYSTLYQHDQRWQKQYIKIHYTVCAQLHFNKCKEIGVKLATEHWYERVGNLVEISHKVKVTILRDRQVKTDRIIPNNKTDIIIRDNENGMLMYVTISGDRNVINKQAENIVKCKDLTTEKLRMWNVRTKVTPIITGETRKISNHS